MLWDLGPRDWGSLALRPVTHLFFQIAINVAVLVSLVDADLEWDIWALGG